MHRFLQILLPVNFLGIWGFWLVWLTRPSEPLTLELITHIAAELLSGAFALAAFYGLRKQTLGPLFFFALGLLFYASLQATGWAFEHRIWPLLGLMLINVLVIARFLWRKSVRHAP